MNRLSQVIKDWAFTQYGIQIQDSQLSKVEEQLLALSSALGLSGSAYFKKLEVNDNLIVNKTIEALTVQESYFFRDSSLFSYLKHSLIPELIATKRKQKKLNLNIWSAGCSAGEEIYSVAIYLDQLLPDINQWNINLLATDINDYALQKAKKGKFTKSSMRVTDEQIIKDYFDVEPPNFFLKKQIVDRVQFHYGNIAKMKAGSNIYDVILCRNVFIYLDKDTILSALHVFYDSLVDNGVLFLGHSDLVTYYPHNFSMQNVNNIYLLKKVIKEPTAKLANPLPSQRASPSPKQPDSLNKLQRIALLLDKKKFSHALEIIDNYLSETRETALLYRYKGEALIGLGDINTAVTALIKSIQLDPLDVRSHFLKSLCEIDLKNNEAAIASLQKTLYLKNKFPEAAYRLGLLYIQNNCKEQGLKFLQQALTYAKEQQDLNEEVSLEHFIRAVTTSILYYQES